MDTGMTVQAPGDTPPEAAPAMRFQARDGAILQAIYAYDGVLARRHIKRLFWPQATWRAMEMRLSRLRQQGYLAWPNQAQRRTKPIPEPVCWLGWKGALWIAGQEGCDVQPPEIPSETQLRQLERQLRRQGIRWLREPRWSQLKHDLAVVDVRLAVERSAQALPALALESWIPESVFRADMDVVTYTVMTRDRGVRRGRRGVRPDGYFVIADKERERAGLPARMRFLLELDEATHDRASFGREKAGPGWAYLKSPQYQARFGDHAGRWLVVTTSQARLRGLMQETQQAIGAGAHVFLFSTFEQVTAQNVFTAPIWWQVGREGPAALLTGGERFGPAGG